jgi:hypothetical protein
MGEMGPVGYTFVVLVGGGFDVLYRYFVRGRVRFLIKGVDGGPSPYRRWDKALKVGASMPVMIRFLYETL